MPEIFVITDLGEKTAGNANPTGNGCPFEGTDACLDLHPENQILPKRTTESCAENSDLVCADCGIDADHTKIVDGVMVPSCSKEANWSSCFNSLKYAPVSSIVNWNALSGNVGFYFGNLTGSSQTWANTLRNPSNKFVAYMATSYSETGMTELFTIKPPASGTGYLWHLGNIDANTGAFSLSNAFKGTDSDVLNIVNKENATDNGDTVKPVQGISAYRYEFQANNAYCVQDADKTKINPSLPHYCYKQSEKDACEAISGYSCSSLDSSVYHRLNW